MSRSLQGQPDRLPYVQRELEQEGWTLGPAAASGPEACRAVAACLAVADGLAAQAYTPSVSCSWRAAAGEYLFGVGTQPALQLSLEAGFLLEEIGPARARLYVEMLMRPLREAAKDGRELSVRAGGLERRPLTLAAPAPD